jgi:hypothetical protein
LGTRQVFRFETWSAGGMSALAFVAEAVARGDTLCRARSYFDGVIFLIRGPRRKVRMPFASKWWLKKFSECVAVLPTYVRTVFDGLEVSAQRVRVIIVFELLSKK